MRKAVSVSAELATIQRAVEGALALLDEEHLVVGLDAGAGAGWRRCWSWRGAASGTSTAPSAVPSTRRSCGRSTTRPSSPALAMSRTYSSSRSSGRCRRTRGINGPGKKVVPATEQVRTPPITPA